MSSMDTAKESSSSCSKKIWTVEEDELLKNLIVELGTSNWTKVGESFLERTGKQCRERWYNHLDPNVKKGEWTIEEDRVLQNMQKTIGNQWAKITKMLPGRTDNAVKNRFHATCRQQSRKDSGDDDKSSFTSTAFEGHTDSDSVEGETPHSRSNTVSRDRKLGSLSLSDFEQKENLFVQQPIRRHKLISRPPIRNHAREEKAVKAAKKNKKAVKCCTFGTLTELPVKQDAASLNEHYIAKLNEYFAAAPIVTPVLAVSSLMFSQSNSVDCSGMKLPCKPHHITHLPLSSTLPHSPPSKIRHLENLEILEASPKRPKSSEKIGETLYFPGRPNSLIRHPNQVPLGLPHVPRAVVRTTGKSRGAAFHELSLKERLAPAPSHSSPTYIDDFHMTVAPGNFDLSEFMFDDWMNEESIIIDTAYVDDIDVSCCLSSCEWAASECSSSKALDFPGSCSSEQGRNASQYLDPLKMQNQI